MSNDYSSGSVKQLVGKVKAASKSLIDNTTTGVLRDMGSAANSVGSAVSSGATSVGNDLNGAGKAVKGGAVSAVKKLKSLF